MNDFILKMSFLCIKEMLNFFDFKMLVALPSLKCSDWKLQCWVCLSAWFFFSDCSSFCDFREDDAGKVSQAWLGKRGRQKFIFLTVEF